MKNRIATAITAILLLTMAVVTTSCSTSPNIRSLTSTKMSLMYIFVPIGLVVLGFVLWRFRGDIKSGFKSGFGAGRAVARGTRLGQGLKSTGLGLRARPVHRIEQDLAAARALVSQFEAELKEATPVVKVVKTTVVKTTTVAPAGSVDVTELANARTIRESFASGTQERKDWDALVQAWKAFPKLDIAAARKLRESMPAKSRRYKAADKLVQALKAKK